MSLRQKVGLWLCHRLGWHTRYETVDVARGLPGPYDHARCGRCGFVGLVDSQGNLF